MWTLFIMHTFGPALNAQNVLTGSTQNESILSGSSLKSKELTLKVDAIFIGTITKIGFPVPAETDTASYSGIEVKVLQVLRGSVDAQIVTVTLRTKGSLHEAPPVVGSSYIFFVHKNTEKGWDPYTAGKLLSATDDNIVDIKKMITQATK